MSRLTELAISSATSRRKLQLVARVLLSLYFERPGLLLVRGFCAGPLQISKIQCTDKISR
jgi:hypothetical protein